MNFPEHKCGLYLEHNSHKDYCEKTVDTLDDLFQRKEITVTEYDEMLAADSIWFLQWYPETPVGSYHVYGSSLEDVLIKANS